MIDPDTILDSMGRFLRIAATVFAAISFAGAATAAESIGTIVHQDVERRYELRTPDNSFPRPRPLVIALHGLRQSLDSLRGWLRPAMVADREGFILALPEALEQRWSYGRPVFNPMPAVDGKPADDIGFIDAMIARLVEREDADPVRIYVVGLSRGGLMAFTLACALADRLAAVAPLITSMTEFQREDCRPARPVPMFILAGTADLIERYDGWLHPIGRQLSVPETIEYWRKRHGCTGQTVAPLPNIARDDRSGIGVVRWTGCAMENALVYYRVFGGGHRVPTLAPRRPGSPGRYGNRNRDIETAEEVWKFFRQHRLPEAATSD